MSGPTDHLGRELEEGGDKPQTVEDFARQQGNLTGPYAESEEADDTGEPGGQ